jgi:hypothetical protein
MLTGEFAGFRPTQLQARHCLVFSTAWGKSSNDWKRGEDPASTFSNAWNFCGFLCFFVAIFFQGLEKRTPRIAPGRTDNR